MIDRMVMGDIPAKPHTVHRRDGALMHEHCLTRVGFDGPFTIAHRLHAPHVQLQWRAFDHGHPQPVEANADGLLLRRHYVSNRLATDDAATPLSARLPLMFSDDVVLGIARPTRSDDVYFENGDADDLFYIHEGGGTLVTMLGDVVFAPGDYVFIPRGLTHRFELAAGLAQFWFVMEARRDVHIPRQFRNDIGQLRMDAPYSHRDFIRPDFSGPRDEGIRTVVAKRGGRFTAFEMPASPLDVIGWDGTVWPWAFPIRNFQPKTSPVHLPPTIHGTFGIGGGLVCSFVPRMVDWHPDAIPCPYPHASVHCDEVIFYCEGNFTSRKGVGPSSISWHPMGTSHGPHPGSYANSIGHKSTNEMAVMLDVFKPLKTTIFAHAIEDLDYHKSFIP